ncbi:E3 ubiquitin-protein ligase RNFT1, partial [Polyodon spathula]|uniref:E3 ubiquitin-protein ligase RNFT1 n=1 Tax=Polyodon spathula TaxID=7913 RepID=UPI001B7DB45A
RPASRRPRSHAHSHARPHSHREPDSREAGDLDSGEPSSSISELRYLLRWLQKSLPFVVILCAKLVTQHALGIAIGVGLLTTFLYANKTIQNQVFLRERRSVIQCAWLVLFLTSSSLWLYYTFQAESLYCCLIFVNPSIESLGLWDVLWIVGITNFILKFLFMGVKCLILVMPSDIMSYRSRGRWYMLTEEINQLYQSVAPFPVWFRYLITYQELDSYTGLTLGILLALVYLILKLLGLYGQWGPFQKTMRIFCNKEHNGVMATKNQCAEAGDDCPICQAEFREPCLLPCQHMFCDECISLWLNQEKTCPLCRTVIADSIHKWKDGATSMHLQIY